MMHEHNEICGGKGKTNDRGTHVPLICNMLGTIPSGTVQSDLIDPTDFLPTIFEAAGLNLPKEYLIDGVSFYPQLTGEKGSPRDWIFFHFEPMNKRRGESSSLPDEAEEKIRFARNHHWKLYETGELYDLDSDLDEDVPIYESQDNPRESLARASLKPVVDRMV